MNSEENIGQHTIFVIISIHFSYFKESSPVLKKQSVGTNLRNGVCETFGKHRYENGLVFPLVIIFLAVLCVANWKNSQYEFLSPSENKFKVNKLILNSML